MLTCREFAHRHASDYLDGQLGVRARLGVWFHLIRCDYCRRFISQFAKIRRLLRDRPFPEIVDNDPVHIEKNQKLGEQLADVYLQEKNTQQKKSPPPL